MIIKAHEMNVWDALVSGYRITTTQYICQHETIYFKKKKTGTMLIDLKRDYVQPGKIDTLSASAEDSLHLIKRLEERHIYGSQILGRIDPGESSALAVLSARQNRDMYFCTGDGAAIEAAVVLGLASICVSLEKLCDDIGIRRTCKFNCTDRHLNECKARGMARVKYF